jgi:hypothetical protein
MATILIDPEDYIAIRTKVGIDEDTLNDTKSLMAMLPVLSLILLIAWPSRV